MGDDCRHFGVLASIVGGATVANQKVSADETTQPVASTTAESDVVVRNA
ncbi:MAG: hypothetical protein ACLUAO_01655 [Streptococcus sp.]